MEPVELPRELQDVENALLARHRSPEEAHSRKRILNRVSRELMSAKKRTTWQRWDFAIGFAASILFALNLATSAANHTNWNTTFSNADSCREKTVAQLREVVPELNESELQRSASVLAGLSCAR